MVFMEKKEKYPCYTILSGALKWTLHTRKSKILRVCHKNCHYDKRNKTKILWNNVSHLPVLITK